jgi:hypothetical protein
MHIDMVELRIDNAVASLAMEGLFVTESDKELARRCIRGEISYDDAVRSIVQKYAKPQ